MRKSQARASSSPPPRANPVVSATVVLLESSNADRSTCPFSVKTSMSGIESERILSTKNLTSAPATKAFPAPSRTIVVTASSALAV